MEYTLRFYTLNKDLTPGFLKLFINKTKSSFFEIKKYGQTEAGKKEFKEENVDDIFKDIKGGFIGKGGNKASKINLMCSYGWDTGITKWDFVFDLKEGISENFIKQIMELIESINVHSSIIYGFLCSQSEFDKLHKEVIYYEDGGSSEGRRGVAISDFSDYLPGIYWFNFFGKELVQALGKDKVTSVPGVKYLDLGKDCIAFHLNEPIDPVDVNERSARLFQINEHIGESYFFNLVNAEETKFNHPPAFKKYLAQIADDFKKK